MRSLPKILALAFTAGALWMLGGCNFGASYDPYYYGYYDDGYYYNGAPVGLYYYHSRAPFFYDRHGPYVHERPVSAEHHDAVHGEVRVHARE